MTELADSAVACSAYWSQEKGKAVVVHLTAEVRDVGVTSSWVRLPLPSTRRCCFSACGRLDAIYPLSALPPGFVLSWRYQRYQRHLAVML